MTSWTVIAFALTTYGANRLEVSPLLWFYYSTAIRKSQEFFAKSFEARNRLFFMDVKKLILPTGSGRGELKKRASFTRFPLKIRRFRFCLVASIPVDRTRIYRLLQEYMQKPVFLCCCMYNYKTEFRLIR